MLTRNPELLACLHVTAPIYSLGLHPSSPLVVCGDQGGALYRLELIGLKVGPISVTAAEGEGRYDVLRPSCQHRFEISNTQLGSEITCPYSGCNIRLKINPFFLLNT